MSGVTDAPSRRGEDLTREGDRRPTRGHCTDAVAEEAAA
jgi:hypothetical protein